MNDLDNLCFEIGGYENFAMPPLSVFEKEQVTTKRALHSVSLREIKFRHVMGEKLLSLASKTVYSDVVLTSKPRDGFLIVKCNWPTPGSEISIAPDQIRNIEYLGQTNTTLILEVTRRPLHDEDRIEIIVVPPKKLDRASSEMILQESKNSISDLL